MKYKDWLDIWFTYYIEPSSKTKTRERYSELIEKHLKVRLGEYEQQKTDNNARPYYTEFI